MTDTVAREPATFIVTGENMMNTTRAARLGAAFAFAVLSLSAISASAQAPVSLARGFQPDPFVRAGQTAGQNNMLAMGNGCSGYTGAGPDAILVLTTDFPWLRIFAESASDTTIAIRTPSGQIICADDTFDRNPGVSQAMSAGTYQIFVGSYTQGERSAYQLKITELQNVLPGSGGAAAAPAGEASTGACGRTQSGRPACVDATSRRTNRGCRGGRAACTLRTGFTPDPWVFPLTAGGGRDPIDVASLNLRDAADNSQCGRSFITPRPDFRFVFTAGDRFPLLRFYAVTDNGADATLLVNTPDGRWRCNDDSYNGRMPTIDFNNPPPGQYDVWVGTYEGTSRNPAKFFVTELDANHP